jgi:DNA mismatch repair endonuclease MutH
VERFDHRTATEDEILERAALLEGMRLGDIPGATFSSTDPRQGRQEVGHAIEAWFGIPPNPSAEPDFPGAGIELKAVPLVRGDDGIRVKERTVISLIDYGTIVDETWQTASVRKKLRILFVFFEHLPGRPKDDFPIHHVLLWEPRGEVEDQIRRDWETIRDTVRAGRAHELSEADGRILGPCTKGATGADVRSQPYSDVPAKPRAFALKPAFTFALYSEPGGEHPSTRELAESASLRTLLRRFQRYVGRTIADVGTELGIAPSRAKGYAASVVRAAVRAASPLDRATFDEIGPTVRMTRVGPDLYPYEALSFPAFRHLELIEEEWEDSTLLSQIERMLIVPVHGRTRSTPQGECVIGEPVYWTPTAEELALIEREWTMFRDLIAAGRAHQLPRESETEAIHVRPHGRDSSDRDEVPGGGTEIRKSFWLNKWFVQRVLIRAGRSSA